MTQDRLKALSGETLRALGRRDAAREALEASRVSCRELENQIEILDLVTSLLRSLIDAEITEGVKAIEALQTEGVRTVFDDQDIRVRAEMEVLRGKVNVSLITSQTKAGDVIEGSSLDGFGGAVSTVQSVLLRLALIFRRGMRPVLFLDESLPAFDERYVLRMASFLKALCARTGVDILLVTHNPMLVEASDNAYRIRRDRDQSFFQKIR